LLRKVQPVKAIFAGGPKLEINKSREYTNLRGPICTELSLAADSILYVVFGDISLAMKVFASHLDIGHTRVTVAHHTTLSKIHDGGGRHIGLGFLAIFLSPIKIIE